ncbi:hypothetical protein C8R46DRAFT_1311232 [Mycena filopes]|nr:hypothetical protein C8R46DRAFT_1311232 [Mycena filopes]
MQVGSNQVPTVRPELQQEPRSTKLPLVDSGSSNRMKLHAHLRSASASSPHKSPPTCTLSLASVSTASGGSIHSTAVPFAAPSLYAFPGHDHSPAGSRGDVPKHLRRPRARTSHVETPRRAQPPAKPVWRTPRERGSRPTPSLSSHPPSKAPPAKAPDLRLAALVERSIRQHMQEHPPAPESEAGLLHHQDALLVERIHTTLLLHKRRTRPSSPTGLALAPPTCAPSVLMYAVGAGENLLAASPPLPMRTPPATVYFVPAGARIRVRARSGSRGSVGASNGNGNGTLSMSALVATLTLRRHGGGRQMSPTAFVATRAERRRMPSPLGGNVDVSAS